MVQFNRWIVANAATTDPPMSVLDTTHATVEQSAQAVADWALAHCPDEVHSSNTEP